MISDNLTIGFGIFYYGIAPLVMGLVVAINGFQVSMQGDLPFGPLFMWLFFLALHIIAPRVLPENWHVEFTIMLFESMLLLCLIQLDPNRTANAARIEKIKEEKQAFMDRLKLKQEDASLADEALRVLSKYGREQIKTKTQLEETLRAYAEKQYWQKMFK